MEFLGLDAQENEQSGEDDEMKIKAKTKTKRERMEIDIAVGSDEYGVDNKSSNNHVMIDKPYPIYMRQVLTTSM